VWKREKNAVNVAEIFRVFDEVQLGEAVEIAMYLGYGFARLLVRGDEDEVGVRVEKEKAEEFRAAVTGAAEDADANLFGDSHLRESVVDRINKIYRIIRIFKKASCKS